MEQVWEYLRAKNKLSYCVWDSHDEILAACADAWNWLVNPAKIPAGTKTPGSEEIAFLHNLDLYRLPDQITDRVIRRPDAAPADRSASDAKISFQNARISLDLGVGPRARYDHY